MKSIKSIVFLFFCFPIILLAQQFEQVESGIYMFRYGEEDLHTPLDYKEPALSEALGKIGHADNPFSIEDIKISTTMKISMVLAYKWVLIDTII